MLIVNAMGLQACEEAPRQAGQMKLSSTELGHVPFEVSIGLPDWWWFSRISGSFSHGTVFFNWRRWVFYLGLPAGKVLTTLPELFCLTWPDIKIGPYFYHHCNFISILLVLLSDPSPSNETCRLSIRFYRLHTIITEQGRTEIFPGWLKLNLASLRSLWVGSVLWFHNQIMTFLFQEVSLATELVFLLLLFKNHLKNRNLCFNHRPLL